jgi:hypothetical protein
MNRYTQALLRRIGGSRICLLVAVLFIAAGVAAAAPNQFVILSDMHTGRGAEPQLTAVSEQLLELKPAFCVTLGDMDGSWSDYPADKVVDGNMAQMFHRLREAGIEIYPTWGNHDGGRQAQYICNYQPPLDPELDPAHNPEVYQRFCKQDRHWYSFNRGGIHFVIVDSNETDAEWQAEQAWLEDDLCRNVSNPNRFPTLVFMHHPEWMTRDHGSSGPLYQFLARCPNNTIEAVFAGHWHQWENFPPEGNLGIQVYATAATVHLVIGDAPEYIIATVEPHQITFHKVNTITGGPSKTDIVYCPITGRFTSLDDRSEGAPR